MTFLGWIMCEPLCVLGKEASSRKPKMEVRMPIPRSTGDWQRQKHVCIPLIMTEYFWVLH